MDTSPLPSTSPMKNSSLAIWSLVLGILGVMLVMACVGPLFAIPAVICGHIACNRIRRSGGALGGEGLAVAGLITGYVGIGIAVLTVPFMAAIAVPNFVKARGTAQKNLCVNNLRLIDGAKQQWALEHNKTANDAPTPDDLDPYIKGGFASLQCRAGGIYTINSVNEAPTCSVSNHVLIFHQSYVPATPTLTPAPIPRQFNPRSNILRPTNFFTFQSNSVISRLQMQETMKINRCRVQLRMIELAKRNWALRNHKQTNDIPTLYELVPYLPGRRLPVCPSGGTYEFKAIGENPTCSIPEHQLPKTPGSKALEEMK